MQSLRNQINQTLNELDQYESKQTKSGATKLRKELMMLSKECGLARKSALESAKAMPVKKREKKVVEQTDEEPVQESPSSDGDDEQEVVEEPKEKGRKKK
jgi:hypothetical protein